MLEEQETADSLQYYEQQVRNDLLLLPSVRGSESAVRTLSQRLQHSEEILQRVLLGYEAPSKKQQLRAALTTWEAEYGSLQDPQVQEAIDRATEALLR